MSGFISGAATTGLDGHILYVDGEKGSDITGARGDFGNRFATITAAAKTAILGDRIIIFPGPYYESTDNFIVAGITFEFLPGAYIHPAFEVSNYNGSALTSQNYLADTSWNNALWATNVVNAYDFTDMNTMWGGVGGGHVRDNSGNTTLASGFHVRTTRDLFGKSNSFIAQLTGDGSNPYNQVFTDPNTATGFAMTTAVPSFGGGTGDIKTGPDGYGNTSATFSGSSFTFFFAMKFLSGSSASTAAFGLNPANGESSMGRFRIDSATQVTAFYDTGFSAFNVLTVPAITDWHVYGLGKTGAVGASYLDGVKTAYASTVASGALVNAQVILVSQNAIVALGGCSLHTGSETATMLIAMQRMWLRRVGKTW